MINFRLYVKDLVQTELHRLKESLTIGEIDSIIDAIVIEWNEIGDQEADFQDIVEWNVDQYLIHN